MTTSTAAPASLMTKLDVEWAARYADRSRDFGLEATCTGTELRALLDNKDSRDEVAYLLLTAARAGNRDAERALVQALIPVARRMAHRLRTLDDFDWGDRVSIAIVAAWEAVRTFKLRYRTRVWANLTMTLLDRLTPYRTANQRHVEDQTIVVDHTVMVEVVDADPADSSASPEAKLAVLFTWAIDTGVLSRDEVALLSRVALGDEPRAQIAGELGLTDDTLRKRVERTRQKLSAAVRAEL